MRFDDSLDTVLAADIDTPAGAEAAWRQLVDLIGRRRAPPAPEAMKRLAVLRARMPAGVRASSARALEYAMPPIELVRFFAVDNDSDAAAPVLRGARLSDKEWIALLPALTPRTRAVLRHRRDLSPAAVRALDHFGAADFVLEGEVSAAESLAPPATPLAPDSFVSLGEAARRSLPGVADSAETISPKPSGPFQISELVARIAAYQRRRDAAVARLNQVPGLSCHVPEAGMFMMLDVRKTGMSAYDYAWGLYKATGVSVLDASAFGPSAAGHLRVSFVVDEASLDEACKRIASYTNSLPGVAA